MLERLLSLVDKSLVRRELEADREVRFLLLETIREFAFEQLQARDGLEAIQRCHANYYTELAIMLCPQLISPHSAHVLAQLRVDFPNIRAALQWLLATQAVEDS